MNLMSAFLSITDLFLINAQCIAYRMESKQQESTAAVDWESILGGRSRLAREQGIAWQGILLAVIVFLHFALLAYVFSWRAIGSERPLIADDALQVTFIDRISPLETLQSRPDRRADNPAPSRPRVASAAGDADLSGENDVEETMPNTPLRLTIESDVWQVDTTIAPKNPLKRQYIAIAGRAEPFVQGIQLAGTLTPKQRLQKIGMLFGAVDYDACKEARSRMANGQSQIDEIAVEADLRAIELHCRP